ncbi:hypothetical protein SeMB42_g01571 [Synchytrium endobioticum]|uniref:Uncharacterized protein n=1 Tax=Synchytrium endobioticum TaxID=286115 RepID=A0A507DF17_9FUNG|nr:hypothetical protein SeLEV6574_g01456 [Synchytrium endobioticum]TPX52242.1 hypothetical protein SeMB42_g01571 [Synchytrium endobioticum]
MENDSQREQYQNLILSVYKRAAAIDSEEDHGLLKHLPDTLLAGHRSVQTSTTNAVTLFSIICSIEYC